MKNRKKKKKKKVEWTKYVHDTLLLLEGLVACHACIIRIPHPDSVLWLNFSLILLVLFAFSFP